MAGLPVSIREVAARAGVSLGTVSKVLNDSANAQIATDTRERVRRAARELGYHPSAVARALVRKQMDTVGVVLPPGQFSPVRSPFFSALFDGVLQAAATYHQNTTVFTGEAWRDAAHSLHRFRDGRCDGLLLFYQPETSDIIDALLDARMPCVLVNDQRDDLRLSCVDVDNFSGGRKMTRYLLGLGHRRIAILAGMPEWNFAVPRVEGYRAAHAEAGVPVFEGLVRTWPSWDTSVSDVVDDLLALPANRRPTALFCVGDDIASYAIAALTRRGVRVPEEISVAGFNDDVTAERVHPPLTTMRQPYVQIGEAAVRLLLEQVADPGARGRRVLLPTELMARGTTAAAPPPD